MSAINTSKAESDIDFDFYRKLGLILIIAFCAWFVLSLALFCICKKKEGSDRNRPLTWFVHYPSRLAFLVWGPWMAIVAHSDLDNSKDN